MSIPPPLRANTPQPSPIPANRGRLPIDTPMALDALKDRSFSPSPAHEPRFFHTKVKPLSPLPLLQPVPSRAPLSPIPDLASSILSPKLSGKGAFLKVPIHEVDEKMAAERDESPAHATKPPLPLENCAQYLDENADTEWPSFFQKIESSFSNKVSLSSFRRVIHKEVTRFFRTHSSIRPEPTPLKTFRFDLAYSSLSYVSNKYFSAPPTYYSNKSTPSFLHDLYLLYTSQRPSLDMSLIKSEEIQSLPSSIMKSISLKRACNRDEAFRLLLNLKSSHKGVKNPKQHSALLTIDDLIPFIRLSTNIPAENPFRVQIILRGLGLHYTALECLFTEEGCECFIMDASEHTSSKKLKKYLTAQDNILRVTYAESPLIEGIKKPLQADLYTCGIFSYDHINHSAKIDNLFALLKKHRRLGDDGIYYISWFDLPPSLIKNAQSLSVIKAYQEYNPKECMKPYKNFPSFNAYIQTKFKTAEIEGRKKTINASSLMKFKTYRRKIESALRNMSAEEIAGIVFRNPLEMSVRDDFA
ncbi:hypothetical protein SCG7109_AC_00340 [Chlamydiales bacterium SCGC AG-110-M15]|nr:hypothetical protein SCG7109_AC_00340 [Chlamydiales bacterium SCGC AG-110-M15]